MQEIKRIQDERLRKWKRFFPSLSSLSSLVSLVSLISFVSLVSLPQRNAMRCKINQDMIQSETERRRERKRKKEKERERKRKKEKENEREREIENQIVVTIREMNCKSKMMDLRVGRDLLL